MANPFYRGPQTNQMSMLDQFNSFRAQFGNGDPRQIVAGLLQSGKMSKEQFEHLSQQANMFRNIFGNR